MFTRSLSTTHGCLSICSRSQPRDAVSQSQQVCGTLSLHFSMCIHVFSGGRKLKDRTKFHDFFCFRMGFSILTKVAGIKSADCCTNESHHSAENARRPMLMLLQLFLKLRNLMKPGAFFML